MRHRYLPFLLLLDLAIGPVSAASPTLGEQKFFRNWAVACDNRLWCESTSLDPENIPDEGIAVRVTRESGTGDVTVFISGFQSNSDRYRILIDGRVANTGLLLADAAEPVKVAGIESLRLRRLLANGRTMKLLDGNGAELGAVSLAGTQAAFRYMDNIQKQARSQTALANRGSKRATLLSSPAPKIVAKRIQPVKAIPDTTTLVSLVESSSCREERYGVTEDTAYSLGLAQGRAQSLVLISCGSGAYNFTSVAYIGEEVADGKWSFSPARFDFGDSVQTIDKKRQLLVNADWSAESQTLSSFAKGRGLGDCGNSESYVWDGEMFRLITAFGMEQCRGSMEWMKLWHADVTLVD